MSLLTRLRGDRRTSISTAVVVVLSGGVAAAAFLYDGEATADVDLDDSGVWVTKQSAGLVGRFNTEAQAIDGTLLAGSADFDVDQQAGDVLVPDEGNSAASVVDVARLKYHSTTAVPAGAGVASGGGRVAVTDGESGDLWVTAFDRLATLDLEEADPTVELGGPAEVAVAQDGTVLAAVPTTDRLWTLAPGEEPTSIELELLEESHDVVLTAVGDDVVVLDRTSGALRLPGGDVVTVADAQGARLQQPGAAAESVAYATSTGLVQQPLDGGPATERRASGVPAAPVQLDGCLYGAWSASGQIVRDCPGTDRDLDRVLEGIDPQTQLEYRVNRNNVVLNDLSAGTVWMALDEYEKVDDWDVQRPDEGDGEDVNADDDTPELVDNTIVDRERQDPPEANDDSFGVRPGRATVLDVLSNDLDPDGDVITAALEGDQPDGLEIQEVLGGKALQAVVPDDATGQVSFEYTVSDGRGGTDTATVRVRVVPDDENAAPEQTGEPVLRVQQGKSAQIRVLPYFRDADGDDVYLATASSTVKGDEVRAYPDGLVEFQDDGSATGRKKVNLTVGDGRGEVVEGTLWVDVLGESQEPPVAVGDHVVVSAGEPVTIEPLKNDSDPNGDALRLASVSEAAPAEITPNYDAGTFTFLANEPKSYDVLYQVSDGPGSTTGVVRVDVQDPDEAGGPPVVVADTALLPAGGSTLVDVLANDSDPAGRVLVVQSVDVPDDAGVTVAVLGHQMLRVTESRRISDAVTLRYTVSNGEETATGQVRILPIPAPDRLQPPHAAPDEVTVHTGDYVNIPVLANDTHPDGLELILDDELEQTVEPGQGEIFASEGRLRFRAGAEAGTAYAIYRVQDPNGQEDSAQVTIHIRDGEENTAPVPRDVEARVLSGGTVRVEVPLDGIDPDGDSVRLLNVVKPPTRGIAEIVDGRYIDFRATDGVSGQDTLTYAVQDSRGETATGTVRIGISLPGAKNHPPVAADDVMTVRPDRQVAVPALRNDSDPDGDQIGLVPGGIEAEAPLDPEVEQDRIVLRTPRDEGTVSFYYAVEDTWGARAMGSVSVEVTEDAPLLAPVARDDIVLPAEVTPDMTSVTVPVLDNDEDPDGAASELTVTLDASTATVDEDGVVDVELTAERQLLTYTVTDQDGLSAKAFLQVPPAYDALADDAEQQPEGPAPRLKPDFVPLEVLSGEPLDVDLRDAVVVAEGGAPEIADADSASAVAGSVTVKDAQHLTYTSNEDYVGPASVSVQVTDGLEGEPEDRTALVQVPITVLPPENLPPEPGAPAGQVAAGEESTVDLGRYASDPDGDDLTFSLGSTPEGVSAVLTGSVVALQADPDVAKGTSVTVPFTVTDGNNPSVDGSLAVDVVASTRPLAKANPDTVDGAHQGEPVSVAVLANDTNPFQERGPLELVGQPTVETGEGEATVDGDQVVVVPKDSFVGTMVIRYRVQDATEDPDREVEGRITVNVLGVPEAPATPTVEEVRSETVVLSWTPPLNNGAEITGYTVRSDQGDEFQCATTTCTLDGLTNNVTYTFQVVATNEVGDSDPSPASAEARPDEKPDPPAAPSLEFGDESLTVTWENANYTDRSPIQSVNLEISPAPASGQTQKVGVTGNRIVWEGLTNGTAYKVRVQAVNLAPDPSDWGEYSTAEIPAGPPDAPGAPSASRVDTPLGGQIRVSWPAPFANGDAVKTYHVDVLRGGSVVDTVQTSATSHDFAGLDTKSSYTFVVTAENKAGKGGKSPASNAVTPFGIPTVPGAPTASVGTGMSGRADVRWGAADANGNALTYTVSVEGGGSQQTTATSLRYGGLSNGSSYRFRVRACNAAGCSAWTDWSNAVKPFGPVPTPSVSASGGDQKVSFSWSTSTNGRGISVRVSGAVSSTAKSGSQTVNAGYSDTKQICVTATDTEGQSAQKCASAKSDPKPQPSVTITKGAREYGDDPYGNCTHSSCRYINLTIRNADPNTTFTYECMASTGKFSTSGTAWHSPVQNTRTDGSGNAGPRDLYCYYGQPGSQVWVTTRWGRSNTITW
ncbi:fibronectin type III domain protein [Isoptericola sp. CG 20/1183]|uniref:Fibronectin type III domain protein n=1 Tax=Isoptericola halotolerans TaxID=300560 RepID=A0ABX5EJ92_9MICO|nr:MULTISPECIES: Ig-like domain-containing protein [Isoptericola]PRZ09711.1 fibronectin type III domain protein [Isoptericola sp. CG 20/1183]PRZ10512.1 fibronectin type III domain protein [Isoptericola halotolerans]